MDDNTKLIDFGLEKATEFVKLSLELAKLKAIDKSAEVVSSIIPHVIIFILILVFLFFLNLGIALWLGDLLSNSFYGFFIVAGFYALIAALIHFFFKEMIKTRIANSIVKQILK